MAIFILILIIFVLSTGITVGFMLGFSLTMQKAARKLSGARRPVVVVGRAATIIGSLSLLLALGSGIYNWHFTRIATRTSGTVIEMLQQTDKDSGNISYAPRFHFQDAAGIPHTVSSAFFQSPPAFQVGDAITVLYLPADPQVARIDSFGQIWGLSALSGIAGGIALSIGLAIILWPKRWKDQTAHTTPA